MKQQNLFSNFLIKIAKIPKFFNFKLIELQKLIESIKHIGLFSPLIKFWAMNLIVYSTVYPFLRIWKSQSTAIKFCEKLIKTPPSNLYFPKLLKSKMILKSNEDWSAFIETNLRDSYHKDIIKPGMNIVDIGAHIGTYAVLVAEKIGNNGKIIAVEPELENYKMLIKNFELNNFKNTIPVNMALSDHNGLEKLYFYGRSTCHSLLPEAGKNSLSIEIKVQTLDSLLESLNIKKVDIIKIDTEGAEVPILKGAKETLKNNPNVKIFVASYHYPGEIDEVQNLLQQFGFKTEIHTDIVAVL